MAFDLISLSLLAVLPMLFIVQFFGAHSRTAAWNAPARPAPAVATTAAASGNRIVHLDEARAARTARTAPSEALAA